MLELKTETWILKKIPDAERVLAIKRLIGGISALVYRVTLLVLGREQSYVLRLIHNQEWLQIEPDLIRHEQAILMLLTRHQESSVSLDSLLPNTPYCIAVDDSGLEAGYPALLMSELAGAVCLPSQPSEQWIEQLAAAIAAIHELPVPNDELAYHYAPYHLASEHPPQQWSKHAQYWEHCRQYLLKQKPVYEQCLIHRDYHPTNVLWYEQELAVAGVVDWVNGCLGPAGVDVGHCRVNLVQLYGVEIANQFLAAYKIKRPQFQYDPYWDICSLFDITLDGQAEVYSGWTALGFEGLTDEIVQQRLDQYLAQIVQLTS